MSNKHSPGPAAAGRTKLVKTGRIPWSVDAALGLRLLLLAERGGLACQICQDSGFGDFARDPVDVDRARSSSR